MRSAVADDVRIHCYRMALGDRPSSAVMSVSGKSLTNKIIASGRERVDTQAISVDTGDRFCATEGIDRINFLKIDAEGYDLKVCWGFERLLLSSRIDLVQVEAGLYPGSIRHVPLQAFRNYLEPMGYWIFRLYDQAGHSFARRCNVVFMSPLQRELHRKAGEHGEAAETGSEELQPQLEASRDTATMNLAFRPRRMATTGTRHGYWWNGQRESVHGQTREAIHPPQGNGVADFLGAAVEMGQFLKGCSEMPIFNRQFMFAHCIVLFVLSRESGALPSKALRRQIGMPIRQAEEVIEELREAGAVLVKDDAIAITTEGLAQLAELEQQLLPHVERGAGNAEKLQRLLQQIQGVSRIWEKHPSKAPLPSPAQSSPRSPIARATDSVRELFARLR